METTMIKAIPEIITLKGVQCKVLYTAKGGSSKRPGYVVQSLTDKSKTFISAQEYIDAKVVPVKITHELIASSMYKEKDSAIVFFYPQELEERKRVAVHERIADFIHRPGRFYDEEEFNELEDQRKVLVFSDTYLKVNNLRSLIKHRDAHKVLVNVNIVETCNQIIRLLGFRTRLGWDIRDLVNFVKGLRSAKVSSLEDDFNFKAWANNILHSMHYDMQYCHIEKNLHVDGSLLTYGINFYDEQDYKRVNQFDLFVDIPNKHFVFDRRVLFELDQCSNYQDYLPN